MTQYLLGVQMVEGQATENEPGAVEALNRDMVAQGVWVFGGGLEPRSTTSVVRATQDGVLVTDGPFAESKEYMAGFWVIEAPDLATAQEWATRASRACAVPIEVTPFDE
ncbi:YciI family protein [Kribbella sp. CA-293567]|uniref:YciI family protein n=1 Tax=Kribbella sp. CA-293567 TaxID=3002436 RepID=UPI0022DE53DE|nr:YciI family protein [Kribbella sp. CA-293567]WBQ02733.1 YciI family protein [Kribbella sp. CA-293567]